MNAKIRRHPAIELFEKLFNEAASQDRPDLPDHFVPRNWFHQKCKEAGIQSPENFIDALKWEEKIGLRKAAKRIIGKYRKAHKQIGDKHIRFL